MQSFEKSDPMEVMMQTMAAPDGCCDNMAACCAMEHHHDKVIDHLKTKQSRKNIKETIDYVYCNEQISRRKGK